MIDVDTSKLDEALMGLQEALRADTTDIVRDETRLLSKQIVKFLPPHTLKEGRKAVKRDLVSLFTGVTPEMMNAVINKDGMTSIDTFFTKEDGTKVRLKWELIDPKGKQMKKVHIGSLNKRGHVVGAKPRKRKGEWAAKVVVPFNIRDRYIRKVQRRVGRLKATMAMVAADLGSTVTNWIAKHFPNVRTTIGVSDITGLKKLDNPAVLFGSRAVGVSRFDRVARDAVRARVDAIKKRTKLILSNYNRDMARGMRAEARAKRSGQGGNYAIT